LLRFGEATLGTLRSADRTGALINDEPVIAYSFEFSVSGQKHIVIEINHRPNAIRDDAREPVLYDPELPSRAMVFDVLQPAVGISDDGHITLHNTRSGAAILWPILCVAVLIIGW